MSQAKTLYGVTYNVPETKDTSWGPTVTAILANTMLGLDELSCLLGSIPIPVAQSTTATLAAGATLTQTHPTHRISGNGGAVTLNAVTSIADGEADGCVLRLIGTSDTNTVRINDGTNTKMNGDVILALGDMISFVWDDTASQWTEIGRST